MKVDDESEHGSHFLNPNESSHPRSRQPAESCTCGTFFAAEGQSRQLAHLTKYHTSLSKCIVSHFPPVPLRAVLLSLTLHTPARGHFARTSILRPGPIYPDSSDALSSLLRRHFYGNAPQIRGPDSVALSVGVAIDCFDKSIPLSVYLPLSFNLFSPIPPPTSPMPSNLPSIFPVRVRPFLKLVRFSSRQVLSARSLTHSLSH